MSEPAWLSRGEIDRLHAKAIDMAGGSHGLRDEGLLESALARPQNLYAYGESDTFRLAAGYAESIARNHPFVDGNKRTAFMAADVFLFKNGHELAARQDDGYVSMMEELAQGHASRDQMADYLRTNAKSVERAQQQSDAEPPPKDWSDRVLDSAVPEKDWASPATPDPVTPPRTPRQDRRQD